MTSVGNSVNFIGRLTKDPEIKMISNERAVCSFCLARNRAYSKDREHPESDFVDCVAWGKTAEFIQKYFSKGNRIGVSGFLQTRMYENKNGFKVKAVEVVVDSVEFIDSKSASTEEKKEEYNNNYKESESIDATPNEEDEIPF